MKESENVFNVKYYLTREMNHVSGRKTTWVTSRSWKITVGWMTQIMW